MLVESKHRGKVRLLVLNNPPANVLSINNGTYAALREEFSNALNNNSCEAIVIAGAGKMFCGGGDLKDLGEAEKLRNLLHEIEQSPKPVVMAMHGLAMGGAVELAMAGHIRIAHKNARFSLPEVTMGLLPGLGGTQRLPRLVGADAALELMLSGRQIKSDEALSIGLIDRIVDGDVIEHAFSLIDNGAIVFRTTADIPPAENIKNVVDERRKALATDFSPAPKLILDSVEAISIDFSKGLAVEQRNFDVAKDSCAARANLYTFFGERKVQKSIYASTSALPQPIESVGIVGGSILCADIVCALLKAGISVKLVEFDDASVGKIDIKVRENQSRALSCGRITQEIYDRCLSSFSVCKDLDEISSVDFVIDLLPQSKAGQRKEIRESVRSDTIYAVSFDENIGNSIACDGSREIGLNFNGKMRSSRLIEVMRMHETSEKTLASTIALAKKIGRAVVVSRHKFIGPRIYKALNAEIRSLLSDGFAEHAIDSALLPYGLSCTEKVNQSAYNESDGISEIIVRCLRAMAAEGTRLLDEGVACHSIEIDMVCVLGYGFTRERGGPFFQLAEIDQHDFPCSADEIGFKRDIS